MTPSRCSVCQKIAGPLAPIPDGRRLCPECLYLAGCVSWDVPECWTREDVSQHEEQPKIHGTQRKQLHLFTDAA